MLLTCVYLLYRPCTDNYSAGTIVQEFPTKIGHKKGGIACNLEKCHGYSCPASFLFVWFRQLYWTKAQLQTCLPLPVVASLPFHSAEKGVQCINGPNTRPYTRADILCGRRFSLEIKQKIN